MYTYIAYLKSIMEALNSTRQPNFSLCVDIHSIEFDILNEGLDFSFCVKLIYKYIKMCIYICLY